MATCWGPPAPVCWKILLTVAGSGTGAAVDEVAVAAGGVLAGGGGISVDADCRGGGSTGSAAVGGTGSVAGLSMSTIIKPFSLLAAAVLTTVALLVSGSDQSPCIPHSLPSPSEAEIT